MRAPKLLLASVSTAGLLLGAAADPASASLILYDGFPAGGDSPTAGQYQSEPASTTGANNDALHGQGPDLLGFSSADAWSNQSPVAATVYPRVNSTGLEWSNAAGTQFLITAEGAAEIFRDGSSTGDLAKGVIRDVSPALGGLGATYYMSGLLQFSEGTEGTVRLVVGRQQAGGPREHFFGFNSDGNLIAGSDTGQFGISSEVFDADTAHLIIARFHDGGIGNRSVDVWINPQDLTDPGAANYTFDADHATVLNLNALRLFAETGQGVQDPSFIFDEIRLGTSFAAVTPWIPEPASLALLGISGLVLLRRRR
ncbi:MAG: PEP-CTERM sorting domain-containing protein [Phycisphaeraceae bacterium]|nr:PEP-CTERM sorting domain-containing protein [Phycisphaeraceae bacterium]